MLFTYMQLLAIGISICRSNGPTTRRGGYVHYSTGVVSQKRFGENSVICSVVYITTQKGNSLISHTSLPFSVTYIFSAYFSSAKSTINMYRRN